MANSPPPILRSFRNIATGTWHVIAVVSCCSAVDYTMQCDMWHGQQSFSSPRGASFHMVSPDNIRMIHHGSWHDVMLECTAHKCDHNYGRHESILRHYILLASWRGNSSCRRMKWGTFRFSDTKKNHVDNEGPINDISFELNSNWLKEL